MKISIDEVVRSGVEQAMKDCELTIGMTLKEAVERQIPKKPTTLDRKNENGMIDLTFKCPACNAFFFGTTANYCRLCGQKFSWSDEK